MDVDSDESSSGSPGEAGFMSVVLLAMFVCLFIGWKTPETVVCLSATIVLAAATLCAVLRSKTEGQGNTCSGSFGKATCREEF